MKSLVAILIVVSFVFGGSIIVNAQNSELLYQKALVKEEGEGDLQEAITLYNQVADDLNAGVSLQAKALLHTGLCYEKLGKQEAMKAYQRLVSDFPGQKQEVTIARERLKRLIFENEKVAKKKEFTNNLEIRKVLANTEIEPCGSPSPDGQYIPFVDWNSGGNLGILDLKTDERKIITDFKNQEAFYSSWSPDGQHIAYFWSRYDKGQYNLSGLSIVDIKNSVSRNLFKSDKYSWIELGNWSSDGKYLLATLCVRDTRQSKIIKMSVDDGSYKVLKTVDKSYLGGKPLFSPDNRYVAYDMPDDKGNSDINILSVESGSETTLFNHPAHDYILDWTPDGNHILFASDRSGSVDAMIIPVRNGKAAGSAKQIKSNIGSIVPMGCTQSGTFYYFDWPGKRNVYSMQIDIENGRIIKNPSLLINRFEGKNGTPAYSNDGRYLAYISKRGIINKGKSETVLCIRDLDNGKEDIIIPPTDIARSISFPTWSPNDSSIAIMCRKDGRQSIYNYEIAERKFTPLVTHTAGQPYYTDNIYPQWSADGKTLYYFQLSEDTVVSKILARDIKSGTDRELFMYESENFMDRIFTIALSPDSKWISAINRGNSRKMKLISTEGDNTYEVYTFQLTGGYSLPQFWSKDGKYIVYACKSEEGGWNLIRIPVNGGEPLKIELDIFGISSPSLHPDGKTLVFSSAGFSVRKNNIWMMENFLPQDKLIQKAEGPEPERITIKQVWTGEDVDNMGQVSNDGKYLSFVDWETADLSIRNLKTGENKRLTHEGSWKDPCHFADVSLIFEDSKRIIYSWYNDDDNYELRTINVDNPDPKIIYKPKKTEQIFPKLLYADDRKVLVQRFNLGKTWFLASVDIENGEIYNLKDFEGNFAINLSVSPDKKFFAFDFPNKKDKGMFDIHLLSIDGNEEYPVVEHPANDRLLGWIPGTNKLLFTSDRSGTTDVWALNTTRIPSVDGPERILTNVGDINSLGYTDNGTLFYSTQLRRCNAYILPFNENKKKLEWRLKEPLLGSVLDPFWTINGESLIYYEREKLPNGRWCYQLMICGAKTGNKKELATNINGQGPPSLSPNGKSVLIVGLDKTRQNEDNYKGGIYSVDIVSGVATEIMVKQDISRSYCVEWNNKGNCIFYRSNNKVLKHNIASGDEIVLCEDERFNIQTLFKRSWDGNHLLFDIQENDTLKYIKSIPVIGGETKILCHLNTSGTPIMFKKIANSADGEFIYLAVDGQENGSILYRIPKEGGEPEKIWQTKNRIAGLSIHPNDNKMAISLYEGQIEIRKIENLSKEIEKIYSRN